MGDNGGKRRKWHAFGSDGMDPLKEMGKLAEALLESVLSKGDDVLVLVGLRVRGFRVDVGGNPVQRAQMGVRLLVELGLDLPKNSRARSGDGQSATTGDVLADILDVIGEPVKDPDHKDATVVHCTLVTMEGLPIPGYDAMAWSCESNDDGDYELRLWYPMITPDLGDSETLANACKVGIHILARPVILLARRTAETDAANARKERDRAARSSGGEKPEVQDLPCFGRQTRGEA